MKVICSICIIAPITLTVVFGDNLPCRVQLTHEHKCFKRRAYESVDHMTTPIADQLQRCFDDNFGRCMLKLGVFAQLSGFSNDAGQQKALKECHFEHFLKYHMQVVNCIKKEHPEMNPNLLLGLPDDKALPAACPDNKDEDRALLVAVVGGRLAKDLKCPALEKCLRDANIDFDSLQSTTCAAKRRCKREHIQEVCRKELRDMSRTTCKCIKDIRRKIDSQNVDHFEAMGACVKRKGQKSPFDGMDQEERAEIQKKISDAVVKRVCENDYFDGTVGLCRREENFELV